ncbi:MAG TPA: HEPN domain-containing protein [Armatimonadota bacterium]|nr:HEPN domain-containing protein [Armatimonadota bacterium]
MRMTAEHYFSAALEHLTSARWLHDHDRFAYAHYFAGIAVECILRAYLRRVSVSFDPRHDLRELAKASRFYDHIPAELHIEYGEVFEQLNVRWRCEQRYWPERELWRYLNNTGIDRGLKGDRHKNYSRSLIELAYRIVQLGEKKWQGRKIPSRIV